MHYKRADAMLIDSCDITDTALAAISIISSTNSGVSDLNITSPFTGDLVDLSDNINLTGCDVWNPQTDGIMFMNTQNSSAKLCSVGKAGGNGIALQTCAQLILDGCTVQDPILAGISIIDSLNIPVRNS